jgi:hypothetical protein
MKLNRNKLLIDKYTPKQRKMSEEATKILHKFQKLKQRNKPLYLKAFSFMNALTQVL